MAYESQCYDEGKKRPSRKVWAWILGALAALLLILLIAGLLTEWFGLYGPLTKIALGAKKLADAGSTTVRFSANVSDDTQVEGTLACWWNVKDRDVAADLQLQVNEKEYSYGIVDGHVVWRDSRDRAKSVDISEELNKFFDSLESESDLDETLEELLETVFKTAGIHKMVDCEEAVACLKDGIRQWNRTGWLEDHAGYSLKKEDGTALHTFEPRVGSLLLALTEQFEPSFKKRSDYLDVVSGLREVRRQMNDSCDVEAVFGISGGALSQISADVEWDGTRVSARIELENIGTTKVDTQALRQIKDEADK